MTDSLIKYFTVFESTNNLPGTIEIGHGENADLVASFTDNGVPANLSGYTARAIYQPKSEWGTDNWFECPCEIVDNTAIAHWGNTYDNGDDAVKLFMHLSKNGKVAYPALYKIRLFETPGFTPSAIEPIPEVIDFSQYTLVNAPWIPLSGNATVTGDITTDHNLIHVGSRTVTFKNIECGNDTESYFNGDIILSFNAEDSLKLLQTTSNNIPIKVQGELVSTGETVVIDAALTDPEQIGDSVKWIVKVDSSSIGDFTFTDYENYPVVRYGNIYSDYIMASQSYLPDTTETVQVSNNYIYDVSDIEDNLANLTGTVNTLSVNVNALSGNLNTLSGNVNIISGDIEDNLANLTGTVNTLSVNVNALSGNLNTLSGNANIISGDVNALSGNLNDLSAYAVAVRHYAGTVYINLRYKKSHTTLTQDNQLVFLHERQVKGLTVPSDSSISTILLSLPTGESEYVTDLIVDIDNRKQTSVSVDLNGDMFALYWLAVDEGESLSDVLSIEGGKISRLYFADTGIYRDVSEIIDTPIAVLHVRKKVLAIDGHSEGDWPVWPT